MAKIKVKTEPVRTVEYQLGSGAVEIGGYLYPVYVSKRPGTVTIYNQAISTDDWTAIASGLADVLSFKLKEKEGQEFDYAFTAAPTTYMTSLGEYLQRDANITAVYAKRRTAVTLNMQLEVWT